MILRRQQKIEACIEKAYEVRSTQDRIPTRWRILMRILTAITFASILLVSACDSPPSIDNDQQAPVAASTSNAHNYRCDSGETIAATYASTDAATVSYKGSDHKMEIAVSGSGARYVGSDLEWWTKGSGSGSEGTLFRHQADGKSGEIVESCKAI
jgi:membrane-bound inhibitor of C-type lysozyme